MEALKKKLKSRQGASILMALLFMLVCVMVGASLVMAASSNAGKIRSNQEEQQKYLILSSALDLLVDELESVKYAGRYKYERREEWVKEMEWDLVYDEDSDTWREEVVDAWYEPALSDPVVHTYTQLQNVPPTDLPGPNEVNVENWGLNVLPLYKYMDYLFAANFKVKSGTAISGEKYVYVKVPYSESSKPPSTYTLDFTVQPENADAYGDLLNGRVRVTVKLDEKDGHIDLTAALQEDSAADPPEYKMTARLKPIKEDGTDADLKELLVPDDTLATGDMMLNKEEGGKAVEDVKAGGVEPKPVEPLNNDTDTSFYSGKNSNGSSPEDNCMTDPIKWKLEYVIKGGESDGGNLS